MKAARLAAGLALWADVFVGAVLFAACFRPGQDFSHVESGGGLSARPAARLGVPDGLASDTPPVRAITGSVDAPAGRGAGGGPGRPIPVQHEAPTTAWARAAGASQTPGA